MKTAAETIFDRIIKEGFQEYLKPLGFKKKGNNFYLQLPDVGQIINIQKSMYYSKSQIEFTINTGILFRNIGLLISPFIMANCPCIQQNLNVQSGKE